MTVFGIIMLVLQAGANLLHLIWTVWLSAEQMQTGWGYGTGMEIGGLYPWLTEILCAPVLLATIVYLVMCICLKSRGGIVKGNIALFAALVLQYGLTNLFIWC